MSVSRRFLVKLADTKTHDNKSTLLHYLVTYLERTDKELLNFPQELSNVEIGAKVPLPYIYIYICMYV